MKALLGLTLSVLTIFGRAAAAPALEDLEPISTAHAQVTAPDPVEVATPSPRSSTASGPMTTNEQIAAFIKSSPVAPWRDDEGLGAASVPPDRQMHGQVGVAVGSRGYRSAFAQSDIPIGRTGTLSVAVEDTRFNGFRGYGGGRGASLGVSLFLGGAGPTVSCRRGARSTERSYVSPSGHDKPDRCSDVGAMPARPH